MDDAIIPTETSALLQHLRDLYPAVKFDTADKDELGPFDNPEVPQTLIIIDTDDLSVVDPLATGDGKDVDPQTYGIGPAAAQAIRQHNKVVFGAGEPKPKRIPLTVANMFIENLSIGPAAAQAGKPKQQRSPLMTPELVSAVANTFIEELCVQIGADNMMKVRARNAMAQYDGACASHDFCDANVCMLNAVCAITVVDEEDIDVTDERVIALMNAAWDLARACQFRMPFMLEYVGYEGHREHHTITFFAEGDAFDSDDLFSVNALDVGQSCETTMYGQRIRITRVE